MVFEHSAKSPYKLSTTERRVIGGLKQLTELLFKEHYKHNSIEDDNVDGINEPLQSDEITTSTECATSSTMDMQTDKENNANGQYQLDSNESMHDEAELFCGMVVQQLTTGDAVDHTEEWHRGQLKAYTAAHERLFERAD